ncbi:sugar phosphate isomerase/epimerase [Sphingobacterium sp. UT-1RO-CII-1]|uniref:sugar phosphate isomerase/epimerase family protein n=1 Tax=Sphingobacterium sp. UT-1RO-CII-1 TaxID=2995225 RepID=UPI00227C6F50|nr:sugar phosphate isomerase/epimerase [Sphingobacterium sp. UT-1RO-CII-1]MCY4779322.1 sugar phosphate isomerase/epimerase [Sphingobacterium sp. UT-1RO-CII-1]
MINSRRQFLRNISLAATSVAIAGEVFGAPHKENVRVKESAGGKGLKLGVAGYSFVHFNLEESLKMMKRMDIHYLCIKDFHLPYDSSDEQIKIFHETLAQSNVKGYAVGPIYMKSNPEIDRAFEYAKRVGVDLIVGIPEPDVLPYVAEKCKEYNIRYGIHNHGPEDKLYPNASVIYNYIKNLDSRMGMCFDMGHNMRDQHDPIKDLIRYKDRIFDLHLKNVTMAEAKGTTCELGRGVIDIPAFVKALNKIKYSGVCSLEFEKDMKDPLAGIAESAGYFKGVTAAQGIQVL